MGSFAGLQKTWRAHRCGPLFRWQDCVVDEDNVRLSNYTKYSIADLAKNLWVRVSAEGREVSTATPCSLPRSDEAFRLHS